MLALTFGTGRFLVPENQGLEPVFAFGANVFKDRHVAFSVLSNRIYEIWGLLTNGRATSDSMLHKRLIGSAACPATGVASPCRLPYSGTGQ